jgi:hypothetical protein
MKKLLIVLMLLGSFTAFAHAWPRLIVFPTSAQLIIQNNNDYDIVCSGTIWINRMSGMSQTMFYNRIVRANRIENEYIPNWNMNDQFRFGNHTIRCRQYSL